MRFVNHRERAGPDVSQGQEEPVQGLDQTLPAGVLERTTVRHDPEVLKQDSQQLVFTHKRVQDERGEDISVDQLEQRAGRGGLASPDVARQQQHPLATPDAPLQLLQRLLM